MKLTRLTILKLDRKHATASVCGLALAMSTF